MEIKVSTADFRHKYMFDNKTDTFWQSQVNGNNDQFSYSKRLETHWIQIKWKENKLYKIHSIMIYLDWTRDNEYFPSNLEIWCGEDDKKCEKIGSETIPSSYVGWYPIFAKNCKLSTTYKPNEQDETIETNFLWLKIPSLHNSQFEVRIRQIALYGKAEILNNYYKIYDNDLLLKKLSIETVQDHTLKLFQKLVVGCFLPSNIEEEEEETNDDENEKKKKKMIMWKKKMK